MPGYPVLDLDKGPQLSAPGDEDFDPQMFADMAKKMGINYEQ